MGVIMNTDLKLTDLYVGMQINTGQISKIYGVHILLSNTYIDETTSFTCGTIEYIGEKNQSMLDKYNECMKKYGKRPMIYYNDYIGGNESWDHF